MRGKLFYSEISISNEKIGPSWENECISFGFCSNDTKHNNPIGWERGSIGIHTDDGGIYIKNKYADLKFGKINSGSIIGIGIIAKKNIYTVFFTLNGNEIYKYNKFKSKRKIDLGLSIDSSYEIKLNIGLKPFKFNLLKHYSDYLYD